MVIVEITIMEIDAVDILAIVAVRGRMKTEVVDRLLTALVLVTAGLVARTNCQVKDLKIDQVTLLVWEMAVILLEVWEAEQEQTTLGRTIITITTAIKIIPYHNVNRSIDLRNNLRLIPLPVLRDQEWVAVDIEVAVEEDALGKRGDLWSKSV